MVKILIARGKVQEIRMNIVSQGVLTSASPGSTFFAKIFLFLVHEESIQSGLHSIAQNIKYSSSITISVSTFKFLFLLVIAVLSLL